MGKNKIEANPIFYQQRYVLHAFVFFYSTAVVEKNNFCYNKKRYL